MKIARHVVAALMGSALVACAEDASAVYLNPDGLGQALIYPYYTVRSAAGNPFNTYVTIVNADESRAKALRIRFREGVNGREVAGFNLFLGARDMWAAAIVPTDRGARLITADRSCVLPAMGSSAGMSELAFRSDAFTGSNTDGRGASLDRVREGYVEVIEMASFDGVSDIAIAATTVGEKPDDCPYLAETPAVMADALTPSGGLMGTLTLINVASGEDFTLNAQALADLATAHFYRPPADPYPDFNIAQVAPRSVVETATKRYFLDWTRGIDAVSSVLMQSDTANEFVLDATTASRSDWILTMPTRRFYRSGTTVGGPFAEASEDPNCDQAHLRMHDRTGRETSDSEIDFTIPPPSGPPPKLCHASTAWTLGASRSAASVFGSANAATIERQMRLPVPANGWASLSYDSVPAGIDGLRAGATSKAVDLVTGAVTSGAFKVLGLPIVGFMARTFTNGNLRCNAGTCQGNYGSAFVHKPTRSVEVAP